MDSSVQDNSAENSSRAPAHIKHGHRSIFGYLFTLVLVAAIAGTYVWQHEKVNSLNAQISRLRSQISTQAKPSTPNPNPPAQSSNVTFTTTAYPLSIPGQKASFMLALPKGTFILPYTEDLNEKGQGYLHQLFADSYGDLIGRYFFGPLQSADAIAASPTSYNYLYITAMSKWVSTSDQSSYLYAFNSDIDQNILPMPYAAMTANQKTAFLSRLASTTAVCVKDPSKGFASSDATLKFCYDSFSHQGESLLDLVGYATPDNQPVILVAAIHLGANPSQTDVNTYIQALKASSLTSETL